MPIMNIFMQTKMYKIQLISSMNQGTEMGNVHVNDVRSLIGWISQHLLLPKELKKNDSSPLKFNVPLRFFCRRNGSLLYVAYKRRRSNLASTRHNVEQSTGSTYVCRSVRANQQQLFALLTCLLCRLRRTRATYVCFTDDFYLQLHLRDAPTEIGEIVANISLTCFGVLISSSYFEEPP